MHKLSCYLHRVTGDTFSITFFLGQKITVVFVRILSRLWCVYYCVIYTQFIGVCFNIFFSESKVNTVFVHNLSSLRCVNYRYIYIELMGIIFSIIFHLVKLFPYLVNVTEVFTSRLSNMQFVYYHTIYNLSRVCFWTTLSPDQSYRGVYVSYY